uniref:C-type lectin ctl-mannose binding n=1 Tax=Daphnia magna TaxID=35525 RepID=A0A0P5YYI5_9CRUS
MPFVKHTATNKTTRTMKHISVEIFLAVFTVAVCFTNGMAATEIESKENCPSYLQDDTTIPCWSLGSKCYCFSNNDVKDKVYNWTQADEICKAANMTLLSIETEQEDMLIYSQSETHPELADYPYSYWTSGSYSQIGYKRWEWATNEPFQPFEYTNWIPGQPSDNNPPNNQPGNCVFLSFYTDYASGYWFPYSCSYATYKRFICESLD